MNSVAFLQIAKYDVGTLETHFCEYIAPPVVMNNRRMVGAAALGTCKKNSTHIGYRKARGMHK